MMDLQILAKYYFYSWEIKSVRGSKRPEKE